MSPSASGGDVSASPLPPRLREAVLRASGAVRPVGSPAARAALVAALALLAAVALGAVVGLRPDASGLGLAALVGPAIVRLLAAWALLVLAMREGVPGSGPAAAVRVGSLMAVPLVLVLLAAWLAGSSPAAPPFDLGAWIRGAEGCWPREVLLALPAAVLVVWLLARAYPLRPAFATTAGAAGAALIADAALHLTCPQTAWSHTLGVHGAAVASVALVAAVAGSLLARRRAA